MRNIKFQKGFTIIELIVSMALFTIVAVLVASIFVKSLKSQRAITDLIATSDNLYFTLEQMAREMRVGRSFWVSAAADRIEFINTQGNCVSYIYVSNGIQRDAGSGLPGFCNVNYKKITSDNVNITKFSVNYSGILTSDGFPTRITLVLAVSGTGEAQGYTTNIQTTTVVRNLDN